MPGSPVRCTIDLDAAGKQFGALHVPRSSNTAGWASTVVPLVTICGGGGPTAVVLGGVHGDEPEGQVAALGLARETTVDEVLGRLIIVPCASMDAARAFTRLWPSGANLNRAFPGSPTGTPDEQLADFLSTILFPLADVVVDMHSGGRSGMHLPWAEMHWVEDPGQRRRMVDAMYAWNTPWCAVYIDIAGSGLLVGEAERQGKVVASTELGGGGHVTAEVHRLTASGLRNVLRHEGVLAGEVLTRATLGLPEQRLLMATELDNYLLAPESGVWETLVDLGDHVVAGDPVGRILFLERPDREPQVVHALTPGTVCTVRAIAPTVQGDCVAVIAREADRSELD
jgi:predicted deacylase